MRPFSRPAPYGRIHRRFEAESARVGMFVACVRACVRACVCTHAYSRDEERGRTGGRAGGGLSTVHSHTTERSAQRATHIRARINGVAAFVVHRARSRNRRGAVRTHSRRRPFLPRRCAALRPYSLGTRVSAQRRARKCLTRRPTGSVSLRRGDPTWPIASMPRVSTPRAWPLCVCC